MSYYCTAFDEHVATIPKHAAWEIVYQELHDGATPEQIVSDGLLEHSECCSEFMRTKKQAHHRAKQLLKNNSTNQTSVLIRKHTATAGLDGITVEWKWTGNEEEIHHE